MKHLLTLLTALLLTPPGLLGAADPFDHATIVGLMRQANDWQTAHPRMKPDDRNWERGTWFTGIMAAHKATGDERYLTQAIDWGRQHQWQVGTEIGRILAALDKSGLAGDTLVIFTSDNGPTWYEADVERLGHASAGGLRGMKSDAWEGGHRMPFIVRWPGRVKAGTVSEQTICFTDLLATFAEICGAKLPNDAGPDSFSFLPVLEGVQPADQPIRAPIVMHAGSAVSMMMIRSGDWKLINGLGSGGFTKPSSIKPKPGEPAVQLYNLRTDPAETTNLAAKHPDKVKELLSAMQANVERGRSR